MSSDTTPVMTSNCVECGDTIRHGEGWSEMRNPAPRNPHSFPVYLCHHNTCKAPR